MNHGEGKGNPAMKKRMVLGLGLALLAGQATNLWAQGAAVPAVPAVPAAPASVAPGGLAQFLGLTKEQKEARRRKCCETKFGQMIHNMLKPLALLSGGILGNFCPQTPSLQDLAKGGAEGAAAKIQADEAEAKKRREAVRYLGTVDCHYWPEAEAALIGSLRQDRNECVRFEAAYQLGGGCCCTKKTIEALLIAATGSDKDGNPAETCERVRAAAYASLQHCLSCFSEVAPADDKPEQPKPPETPKQPAPPENPGTNDDASIAPSPIQLTAYYHKTLAQKSLADTIREARKALSEFEAPAQLVVDQRQPRPGVLDIVLKSVRGPKAPEIVDEETLDEEAKREDKPTVRSVPRSVEGRHLETVPTQGGWPKSQELRPVPTPQAAPMSQAAPRSPSVQQPALPVREAQPMVPVRHVVPTQPTANPQAQAQPSVPDAAQLLGRLRTSVHIFEREHFVNELARCDARKNPEIVEPLLQAARKDPAPTVRASAIRALVKLQADPKLVYPVVQAARTDSDPRVVYEAEQALARMTIQPAVPAARAPAPQVQVQPVGYQTPTSSNAFSTR
jgi:hypothetical protein